MAKQKSNGFKAFAQIQATKPLYHLPRLTWHEQAIREHKQRGLESGLTRVAGLLVQANRI